MVEIYGQEASGKTTLALHVIKEAQKLGGGQDPVLSLLLKLKFYCTDEEAFHVFY